MAKKLFILSNRAWEYNDESYFLTDGEHPAQAFCSREQALADARVRAKNLLCDDTFEGYLGNGESIPYDLLGWITDINPDWEPCKGLPPKITPKLHAQLIEFLAELFFTVTELEAP